VALYSSGAPWWVDTSDLAHLAADEQSARYESDAWDTDIANWISIRDTVSVAEVLAECLKKDRAQWTQTDSNRVARSLRSMGWERFRERTSAGRTWRYRRQGE
jgi:predicted P-loop ATPase